MVAGLQPRSDGAGAARCGGGPACTRRCLPPRAPTTRRCAPQPLIWGRGSRCRPEPAGRARSLKQQAGDGAEQTTAAPEPPAAEESAAQPAQQSPATATQQLASLASLALLISPFFFWGTSMVAMKALDAHTAPLFVSAVRMLPAGLVLLIWAAAERRPQPVGLKAWLWITAFALADATSFQGCLAEGLQRTSAGLGSVIIDSQPLSVALMASILFGERLSAAGYAGLVVGVLGLCLLEIPADTIAAFLEGSSSGSFPALSGSVWDSGEWWMLLAAQSMAVGTVLVRYVSKYADPLMATAYHMLLGGVPLLLLSAAQEGPVLQERLPLLTGADLLLLAFISLFGSAASYGVFFVNASRGNLTALSSLTFLTPCFAAATGYLTFGETLTPQQLLGTLVTLGGVYFISRSPKEAESA